MKKKLSILLVFALALSLVLTGCGKNAGDKGEETKAKDSAILVVSFGTSYNESREATIEAIEKAVAEKFSDYDVRRAFTSQIIIDKLEERDGLDIDNVTEALDRAVADEVKTLVVQPTHLMDGLEYNDLKAEVEKYKDKFDKVSLGAPLLTDDSDFEGVIAAITEATKNYDNDDTAVVFMGHGTTAPSNSVYSKLQEKITAAGYDNYYIGTVEAAPALDDIVKALNSAGKYKKVVLQPLMVVAGDHANNDMAGDEADSWKTVLSENGYEVECVLEGLGQIEAIRDIYIAHTQAAIDALK